MELVFIYKSPDKKSQDPITSLIEESCHLIGVGHVRGKLLKGAESPALVEDPEKLVKGEIYIVNEPDALEKLDSYEGPSYIRKKAMIHLDDGTHAEAWVYYDKGSERKRS